MSQTDGATPDDILLSRYCRQKDLTAFSALIDRHQADLLRTAQEGFLRLSRDAEALVAKWRIPRRLVVHRGAQLVHRSPATQTGGTNEPAD